MNPKVKKVIPFIFYVFFLLGLSSVPSQKLPQTTWLPMDKAVHFGLYAGAGIAFYPLFSRPLTTWIATAIMGGIDENYQRLTPGRSPDWNDWFADLLGGAFGTFLAYSYVKKRLPS